MFEHEVVRKDHPLVADTNTRLHVPHSRFNEVYRRQFESAGLHVLIEGQESGVQLAVSADGFRTVLFQGHPEYDGISLLKEYKRDVGLYIDRQSDQYPPFPVNYFDKFTQALLNEYRERVINKRRWSADPPPFPEALILKRLHNTWHDSGEAIIGNWVGLVYQITHRERGVPFMEGIDRDDPLGWLSGDTSRLM